MSFSEAYELWCVTPLKTYVFEKDKQILGSYFIKPNGMGPDGHICNCGYMVNTESRGKGIARELWYGRLLFKGLGYYLTVCQNSHLC